jgi:hypothetical protein
LQAFVAQATTSSWLRQNLAALEAMWSSLSVKRSVSLESNFRLTPVCPLKIAAPGVASVVGNDAPFSARGRDPLTRAAVARRLLRVSGELGKPTLVELLELTILIAEKDPRRHPGRRPLAAPPPRSAGRRDDDAALADDAGTSAGDGTAVQVCRIP